MVYPLPFVSKRNDAYLRSILIHRALSHPTRGPLRIALFASLDQRIRRGHEPGTGGKGMDSLNHLLYASCLGDYRQICDQWGPFSCTLATLKRQSVAIARE